MISYRVFVDAIEEWATEAADATAALAAALAAYPEATYLCVIGPGNEREVHERRPSFGPDRPVARLLNLSAGKVAYFDSYGNTLVSG